MVLAYPVIYVNPYICDFNNHFSVLMQNKNSSCLIIYGYADI